MAEEKNQFSIHYESLDGRRWTATLVEDVYKEIGVLLKDRKDIQVKLHETNPDRLKLSLTGSYCCGVAIILIHSRESGQVHCKKVGSSYWLITAWHSGKVRYLNTEMSLPDHVVSADLIISIHTFDREEENE